jgi:predicted nucleotidyltransferase
MTVNEAFQAFKSELELTDKSQDAAASAQQEIRAEVAKRIYVRTSFLTGSYARHTKIHPLSDIDVFLVRNDNRVALDTTGGGVQPNQALADLANAVRQAYPKAKIITQAKSVNAEIPGVAFGFDLIPAWYRSPDGYWIPDVDNAGWFPTDPQAHADLMTAANDANDGMLKPLIKMTKHWSRHNFDRLRSFHLELVCKDILNSQKAVAWALGMATILVHLGQYAGAVMMDPVYQVSRIDKALAPAELTELLRRIQYDAGNALEALRLEGAGNQTAAIDKWKHVFTSGFPSS